MLGANTATRITRYNPNRHADSLGEFCFPDCQLEVMSTAIPFLEVPAHLRRGVRFLGISGFACEKLYFPEPLARNETFVVLMYGFYCKALVL